MSAIVPAFSLGKRVYDASRVYSAATAGKRARMAYKMGKTYGPSAYSAAKTIAMRYRKYKQSKAKRRTRIGEEQGTSTTKRDRTFFIENQALSTRTLYVRNLTDIERTTTNDIDKRQRDIVNFRGVKLCFEIENNNTTVPLIWHYAVISPKGSNTDVSNVGNKLFRASEGNQRFTSFGTALSSIEFDCLPINSDRWVILTHKKFMLGGRSNPGADQQTWFRTIQDYVKVNRQLRYNDDATVGVQCETPILCVWWCDYFSTAGGTSIVPSALQVSERHINYWNEPTNCC